MTNTCFLSGTSENLMQIIVDSKPYHVSESIADTCTAKQLNDKIRSKIAEDSNKKTSILAQVDDMAKGMGISKEELIKFLGGVVPGSAPFSVVESEPEAKAEPVSSKMVAVKLERKDEGFKDVPGGLVSPIRARVSSDDATISGSVPGYSGVKDGNNKSVVESDKKVKTIKDTMIIKSNMGTTTIQVKSANATQFNKTVSQVDEYGNLIRKSATGGHGSQGSECSLCRGTGFTAINQQTCQKCNGAGFIY